MTSIQLFLVSGVPTLAVAIGIVVNFVQMKALHARFDRIDALFDRLEAQVDRIGRIEAKLDLR